MYRILVVDDEKGVRDLWVSLFAEKYHVAPAAGAEEALSRLSGDPFDLVIADINMPGTGGPELLDEIRRRCPQTAVALMTGYNVNDHLLQARRFGISTIFTKTTPPNFHELDVVIETILTKTMLGLSPYLLDDGSLIGHYTIRSSVEAMAVRMQVATLFEGRFGRNDDMHVLLDEIISNALYHAPVRPDGAPKYEPFTRAFLEEQEYIEVECGYDGEKYGVSVTDDAGRLTADTVLERLTRQISGEGVLDSRGRGLHMSWTFADRMIINVKPGVRTEVILINYFTPKYRGFKPLYANEL